MDRIQLFKTFLDVHEAGSLSASARSCGTPVATVSRHLALLEQQMGAPLFHRTTRSLRLTDAGLRLLPHAQSIVQGYELAMQSMAGADYDKTVRIGAPIALSQAFVTPALVRLAGAHPRVKLELIVENRKASAAAEGLDILVQTGMAPFASNDLVMKTLGAYDLWLCCAPTYLAAHQRQHGRLDHPSDLALDTVPWLGHLAFKDLPGLHLTREQDTVPVPLRSTFWSNDLTPLMSACELGLGVAILPRWLAASRVRQGHLVRLLADWTLPRGQAWVAWKRGWNAKLVRSVVQHLQQEFALCMDAAASNAPMPARSRP